MVESQSDKNFLHSTKLPSIGCFLSVLQFSGGKKELKSLLKTLTKSGLAFYNRHIKSSTEFSERVYIQKNRLDMVKITLKTGVLNAYQNFERFVPAPSFKNLYLSITFCRDITPFLDFMAKHSHIKVHIYKLDIYDNDNTSSD